MEFWYVWLLPIIGFVLWVLIAQVAVRISGNTLQKQFIKLGTLKGKTLAEIQKACGDPISISYGEAGVKICQWMRSGYNIVLLFDENNICLGVNSETRV